MRWNWIMLPGAITAGGFGMVFVKLFGTMGIIFCVTTAITFGWIVARVE